jgi:ADP-heptose:LPS heptosyltransferase
VLALRAGALGDLLLLRPALATLKRAGAVVELVSPPAGALLGPPGLGEVDGWTAWDDPRLLPLHRGEDDVGAVARTLGPAAAAVAWTASPELVRNLRRFVPEVRTIDPRRLGAGLHVSVALAGPVLELVGGPLREAPRPRPHPEDEPILRDILPQLPPRFLALHPGSGSPRKNWPAERFRALAERLSPAARFLLVEGPADEEPVREIGRDRVVVARGLPLRALGALLGRAALFVGNDAGVSHLAATFGAPTLALFGPTDPTAWAPLGPNVGSLRAPQGDLASLEVDAVVHGAESLLRSWGRPGPPFG